MKPTREFCLDNVHEIHDGMIKRFYRHEFVIGVVLMSVIKGKLYTLSLRSADKIITPPPLLEKTCIL